MAFFRLLLYSLYVSLPLPLSDTKTPRPGDFAPPLEAFCGDFFLGLEAGNDRALTVLRLVWKTIGALLGDGLSSDVDSAPEDASSLSVRLPDVGEALRCGESAREAEPRSVPLLFGDGVRALANWFADFALS